MAHLLVTFLGKGLKAEGGYRTADYLFESGSLRTSTYIGLALLDELADSSNPVDHLLILGTSSSIWDALLAGEMKNSELWVELGERVEKEHVYENLLSRVAADVQNTMNQRGLARQVTMHIIPICESSANEGQIIS